MKNYLRKMGVERSKSEILSSGKAQKAMFYLLGGIVILLLWSLISKDVDGILNRPDVFHQPSGKMLKLLLFKYLFLGFGWSCFTIGAAVFVIALFKKLQE